MLEGFVGEKHRPGHLKQWSRALGALTQTVPLLRPGPRDSPYSHFLLILPLTLAQDA